MASLAYRIQKRIERTVLPILLRQSPRQDLQRLGSGPGGYHVPMTLLSASSICYSAGVGEELSFDLELIAATHCQVFAFDPTPRAIDYVKSHVSREPRFELHPLGLWHRDETLRFFAPQDPRHVSHSVVNLQKTSDYFEASCKRLSSIMRELGHDRLDLLKLNIEGAQYVVIDSIIEDRIPITVLCVAIDQPTPAWKVFNTTRKLQRFGYALVKVDGWTYTFVKENAQ